MVYNAAWNILQKGGITMNNLNSMYILARTAFRSQKFEEAVSYYEQIMSKIPFDWEANFYFYVCYTYVLCKDNSANGAIYMAEKAIDTAYNLLEKEQDLDKMQNNTNTTNTELENLLATIEQNSKPRETERIRNQFEQRKNQIALK
jgi:tetratricopeptide (TPR) repeat protein